MTPRHVHADLIIAWANGAQIQLKVGNNWIDAEPFWRTETYRIKPEPKPDRVMFVPVVHQYLYPTKEECKNQWRSHSCVKQTWDGETGKLKSVEIVE
jgi:hypothetical protein